MHVPYLRYTGLDMGHAGGHSAEPLERLAPQTQLPLRFTCMHPSFTGCSSEKEHPYPGRSQVKFLSARPVLCFIL